jgi:hypothetical protein
MTQRLRHCPIMRRPRFEHSLSLSHILFLFFECYSSSYILLVNSLLSTGYQGRFHRGGKAAGTWSWPLTSVSCRCQEWWRCTSIPSYVFMAHFFYKYLVLSVCYSSHPLNIEPHFRDAIFFFCRFLSSSPFNIHRYLLNWSLFYETVPFYLLFKLVFIWRHAQLNIRVWLLTSPTACIVFASIVAHLPHARTVEPQKEPCQIIHTRNNRTTGLWNTFLGNSSVKTFQRATLETVSQWTNGIYSSLLGSSQRASGLAG